MSNFLSVVTKENYDCGLNNLENVLITLIRFRCHRYGLTAAILKMYRQVLVHLEDRQLQLFLWVDDTTKTAKFAPNTYGTASAPYLAIRNLHYAAKCFPKQYHLGKTVITNNFYVDDMVKGTHKERSN